MLSKDLQLYRTLPGTSSACKPIRVHLPPPNGSNILEEGILSLPPHLGGDLPNYPLNASFRSDWHPKRAASPTLRSRKTARICNLTLCSASAVSKKSLWACGRPMRYGLGRSTEKAAMRANQRGGPVSRAISLYNQALAAGEPRIGIITQLLSASTV